MEININDLVTVEKVLNNSSEIFQIVDAIGKVIILKDNKTAYIMSKCEESAEINTNKIVENGTYTLQEVMKIVLKEVENSILHTSELADIIYERKLYV